MRDLVRKNRWFYFPFLLMVLGGAAYLPFHDKGDFSLWLNNFHSPLADQFFEYATWLGDGITITILCALLLFIKFRYAFIAGIISILSLCIVNLLKNIFNEPRPVEYFKDQHLNFIPGVQLYHWLSFPSGHTAGAFAFFCTLGFFLERKSWAILCFLCAATVAVSRVYLFQHFLVDVYAGAIIGVINSSVFYWMLTRIPFFNRPNWTEGSLIRMKAYRSGFK